MSKKYEVKATKLNVRSNTSLLADVIRQYKKGDNVTVYKEKRGDGGINWGKVSKSASEWVDMEYLKAVSSSTSTDKDRSDNKNKDDDFEYIEKENTDKAKDDTIYGNKTSSYNSLYNRYLKAFGCPPMFTEEVDPRYTNSTGNSVGRAAAKTWFSNPAILSICPGTVDYLPGFSLKKDKKEAFYKQIRSAVTGNLGDLVDADKNTDLNGQLYAFKTAYKDYMNVVNLLARTSADLLGIGNVKNLINGASIPLNMFDYGYYTSAHNSQKAFSIFEETKNALNTLNTAVSDSTYIHFFVNYTNGVTGSESIKTEDEESWLESQLGGQNDLSSMARNIQFLFGSTLSGAAESDLKKVFKEATKSSDFLGGLTTIATNYLKGGQLVFPRMIKGMSYDKSIQCELTFSSIYGDKRSIFKYVILPALHLLALATPKQLSSNMYTYPFLVRAYQKGNVNTDLAFISNLELTRGGSDNTSWTVDGLATEITARFTITPLYSNLMVTSARNPFLFMQNSALLEYLGTMCGLDLKQNNLDAKVKLAKSLIKNLVHDTPTVTARGFADSWFANELRNFTQIIE